MKTAPVPSVGGMSVEDAKEALGREGYEYTVRVVGEGQTVVSQVPNAGVITPVNGVVVLYTQNNAEKEMSEVPDFEGLTVAQANYAAIEAGLNIRISGSASMENTVVAYKQDVAKGTSVESGAVITVSFRTTSGVHD